METGGKRRKIRKNLKKSAKKCLLLYGKSAKIFIRDTLKSFALETEVKGQRPQGGKAMNKYELAVVLSAKLEDERELQHWRRYRVISPASVAL